MSVATLGGAVPRTWFQIEVHLLEGRGERFDPAPGRVILAGGTQTFADLSRTIDGCFARWDLAHLHVFQLADGRLVGPVDPDEPEEDGWLDEEDVAVSDALKPGDEFVYTFDLSDQWRHQCRVAVDLMDPRAEVGEVPIRPVPIWGWGMIPDQYGRTRPDG